MQNFKFTKGSAPSDDVSLPQNAHAKNRSTPEDILKYFSIDLNKNPLLTTLKPGNEDSADDDEWFDNDYIEIPNLQI